MTTKVYSMRYFVFCFLLLVFVQAIKAQDLSFAWAKRLGGTTADAGNDITTDANGNVYTIGTFEGAIDFDPGPGAAVLISNGGADVFIEKMDSLGNFIWVKRIGGSSTDYANSIDVDAAGNVYYAASFFGTVDVDPGAAVLNYTAGGMDICLAKLNPAGNLVWAKQIGSTFGYEYVSEVGLDANGYLYMAGTFNGTTDFDPNAGTAILTSVLSTDAFFEKLDTAGNYVWVKQLSIEQTYLGSPSASIDDAGNMYVTGNFRNTVDLDPGPATLNYTSNGGEDYYAVKLDPSGNLVWARAFGGYTNDFGTATTSDAAGNIYIVGTFSGNVDFDPGPAYNDLNGGPSDVFIHKLDASGNYVWATQISGTGGANAGSVKLDALHHVLVIGAYQGTMDFDPNQSAEHYVTTSGYQNVFLEKLDPNGNFEWVKTISGSSNAAGSSVHITNSGSVYCTGKYSLTGDFDPGRDSVKINAVGNTDVFIQKLKPCAPYAGNFSRVLCAGEMYSFGSQTITATGTYTETFTGVSGCDSVVTLTIISIASLPIVTASVFPQAICPGQNVIFSGGGAASYSWSGGVTEGVPHAVSQSGTYTVTGTDANNCSNSASVSVLAVQAPVQEVCVVSVDSATAAYTTLVWEKPGDIAGIDSFYIYREITLNNYQKIGAVYKDSLSEYNDFSANPNVTNYKYKLTTLDTCGNESAKGLFHNTIHLQYFGSGNFQWTNYLIENTPNPVAAYNFYRDDNSTGNFVILQVLPGTNNTFTDVNYTLFPNASYRVEVTWNSPHTCTPTRGAINTSRSNVKSPTSTIGLQAVSNDALLRIYPQPAHDKLFIEADKQFKTIGVEFTDALGHLLMKHTIDNTGNAELDLTAFAPGVYILKLSYAGGNVLKKIVVAT